MKYNKNLIWIFFISIVCDMSSTFFATPNLEYEYNTLVSEWGLGWTALIVQSILIFLGVSFFYKFCMTKIQIVTHKKKEKLDWRTFLKTYFLLDFFENKSPIYFFYWNTQLNRAILKMAGYIIICSNAFARFIISLQNTIYGAYYRYEDDFFLGVLGLEWSIINHKLTNLTYMNLSHPTFFIKDYFVLISILVFIMIYLRNEYKRIINHNFKEL